MKASRKKIVLTAINAKYIHSNLAVYSLRKYAEEYAENIELAEYTINQNTDDILRDLYKKKPDVLAISCYIWNISMVFSIIKELKKVLPSVEIWLGGPEVSYDTEKLLQENPCVDGVMVGEGEATFLACMAYWVDGNSALEEIDGLVFKKEGQVVRTKPRLPMDLSKIPFPYDNLDDFTHKIVYYETSRGCPFCCSYCLSSIERGVRLRDLNLVKKELQFFLDRKVPQVKFIDRTFNCNHEHAMGIWTYILEHDNGVTNFHFEVSADLLREEELELLGRMRVGLVQLEIGVQSTNARTIQAIHRTMNLEKLSYAVERVRQGRNIHQHLDLIAGLPYEDYESFNQSFNQVYAWKPDQLQLGFLKVLKGSGMYLEQDAHGILYKGEPPYEVMATRWLSYDEVLVLKNVEEMVEVYYNSGQFTHTLQFLLHFYTDAFSFYKELGDYYERQGLQGLQHARIARYDILLAYVEESRQELVAPLKELLVYDLYLRENMKSRPAFGADQAPWKDRYYGFYKEMEFANRQGDENPMSAYTGYQARQMARMTHIETFTFDLKKLCETGTIAHRAHHILFDYKKRHPLTQDAKTLEITI